MSFVVTLEFVCIFLCEFVVCVLCTVCVVGFKMFLFKTNHWWAKHGKHELNDDTESADDREENKSVDLESYDKRKSVVVKNKSVVGDDMETQLDLSSDESIALIPVFADDESVLSPPQEPSAEVQRLGGGVLTRSERMTCVCVCVCTVMCLGLQTVECKRGLMRERKRKQTKQSRSTYVTDADEIRSPFRLNSSEERQIQSHEIDNLRSQRQCPPTPDSFLSSSAERDLYYTQTLGKLCRDAIMYLSCVFD
jgi:hypothetical protein